MPPRLTDRNVGSTLSHDKLAAEKGGKSPAYDASNEIRCGIQAERGRVGRLALPASPVRLRRRRLPTSGAGRETRNLCSSSGSLAMLAAILHASSRERRLAADPAR
jgi:hypothetical protein